MDKKFETKIKRCSKLAKSLAESAGEIQMLYLAKKHSIEYKGAINIVTEVDKKCEKLIFEGIKKDFPDHDVLAEEGIAKRCDSDFRWIVDPLDGTVNYAHGFPFFCVSIALEYKGDLVCAVIYDPTRDELFSAVKGKGAFLNNKKIKVSESKTLKQALIATGFAYNIQDKGVPDNLGNFTKFIKKARAVRRPGAAALDLAYVACGRLDGFWELFLQPWDIAAGILIIKEARGRATDFCGNKIDIYGDEILVSNGKIHKEMIEILI